MRTEIVQCIGDATQIAVALATAKRQPPRDATIALDRLLSRLNAMVVIPDLAAPAPEQRLVTDTAGSPFCPGCQRVKGTPHRADCCVLRDLEEGQHVCDDDCRSNGCPERLEDLEEELDPDPEEIAAAARFDAEPVEDPEAKALREQLAAVQAQIAKAEKPRPVLSPSACRPEPAQTRHVRPAAPQVRAKAAKQREPRLPTAAEVVAMLERVMVIRDGATVRKGKADVPVSLVTMAERWLTEERRYRKQLRERAVWDREAWDELAARTPERLCKPDMTQDPTTIEGSMAKYDAALAEQKREQEVIANLDREAERRGKKIAWGERAVWERDLGEDGSCRGCGQDYHHRHLIKCKCLNE